MRYSLDLETREVGKMYYKIRNDVLFRKYQGHGYIADNSEYQVRYPIYDILKKEEN